MNETPTGMRPIWFFVGWLLTIIGGIVLIAGIVNFFTVLPNTTVVARLHPNLWWGAILIIVGIAYILKNKGIRLETESRPLEDTTKPGEGSS